MPQKCKWKVPNFGNGHAGISHGQVSHIPKPLAVKERRKSINFTDRAKGKKTGFIRSFQGIYEPRWPHPHSVLRGKASSRCNDKADSI